MEYTTVLFGEGWLVLSRHVHNYANSSRILKYCRSCFCQKIFPYVPACTCEFVSLFFLLLCTQRKQYLQYDYKLSTNYTTDYYKMYTNYTSSWILWLSLSDGSYL